MRLLVLVGGYPWGDNLAGAFHRDQLRLMAAMGLEMTVVAPMPWVPPGLAGRQPRWRGYAESPRRQEGAGFTVLRPRYFALPRENRWFWPDLFQERAVLGLGLSPPDAILAYYAFPLGAAARRLARRWRVPYAVGMLGDDVNIYPHLNARNLRLFRQVVEEAGFAFANGPTLAATAERLGGAPVEMLSLGVSSARFAAMPAKAAARAALGLPAADFIALYVGALTPNKGMNELAAAMDSLSGTSLPGPVRAVLVGDGPLRPVLEGRPNITCLGSCPPETVVQAMAAADLLVHPSHYEGLPTALVEAGFAGLPVLTTDTPGCLDLAGAGRGLIVPVRDAQALAAALTAAAADPAGLRAPAAALAAHVRTYYDLEACTARLVAACRGLAGAA